MKSEFSNTAGQKDAYKRSTKNKVAPDSPSTKGTKFIRFFSISTRRMTTLKGRFHANGNKY